MAKYQAYAEYKDSGIDWMRDIPAEWSISRLKYIFTIKKRIAGELGFDVLSITQRGIKIKDTESGDGQLSMDYSKYQLVYPGDFAMNHMDLLTGYVDISKYNGVTSPDYRVFTIENQNQFYSKYYLYLLQMGYKQQLFFHLGQGSSHLGRWRLPTDAFQEIEYPVPSRNEQIAIANFLDHETSKIDHLIEKQQQLIELLKEKRQAVISHAVTKGLDPNVPMKDSGVEWLGEVPEHWFITVLKNFSTVKGGYAFPSEAFSEIGEPVIRIGDINSDGSIDIENCKKIPNSFTKSCSEYLVENGSLLMAMTGGTIGKVGIYKHEQPAYLNQRVGKFLIKNGKLTYLFLKYLLKSEGYQKYIVLAGFGGAQPNISDKAMVDYFICIPPIEEQQKISLFLERETKKIAYLMQKAEEAIQLMQERRTALISAAVTGKIDVRNWQAPSVTEADTELSA